MLFVSALRINSYRLTNEITDGINQSAKSLVCFVTKANVKRKTNAMTHENTISVDHQLLTDEIHEILKQTGESTLPSETKGKITRFVESNNREVNELKQRINKLVEEVAKGAEEIKDLKKQLSQLRAEKNTEKKEWEKRVKSLETQVKTLIDENKCLTAQVKKLNDVNQENAMLEGENMQLEEQIANLQERVTGLTGELTDVRRECQCLQDKLSSMVSPENDLELGELCWRIQSMIFKKILPPSLYSETFPYNLYFINHEILRLPFDMRDKAEKAWAKLQQELQPIDIYRLTSDMREIQSERNSSAHPRLTEEILYQLAERMKDEGRKGVKSYESVMKLIKLWKKLGDMQ